MGGGSGAGRAAADQYVRAVSAGRARADVADRLARVAFLEAAGPAEVVVGRVLCHPRADQ
jgi:hypothetical protein